jgi:hypothetical protein
MEFKTQETTAAAGTGPETDQLFESFIPEMKMRWVGLGLVYDVV